MKLFNLKYKPLTIVVGFNLFTLVVFYTAPIGWATDNLLLFLFFSLFCQLMIVLGYRIGYEKAKKVNFSNIILQTFPRNRLNFILYFYTLTVLIKYAYLLKFSVFDIVGMISLLMLGINDPQTGYNLSLDESRSATISWSIYFLICIINHVFFIIGFIKWGEMSGIKKIIFSFFVLIEVFFWMGRGINFGVICLFTTLAFAFINGSKFIKLDVKKTLRYYLIIISLLIASISVFSYNMTSRAGEGDIDFQAFNLGTSNVNENAAIFSVMPEGFKTTYMFMVSYLTQGYYHTCLAFDLDFKPTFFLGNNPASISLAEVINIHVWEDTYMYRLREKGVDPFVNWHSAYTWYASDFSFFGVPIILFFIGYMFGFSWSLCVSKNDFLSIVVFIVLANMLLYIFANNTYLSYVYYSFMFILPIWFFTRVKRITW